ncbi:MAG: phenylpyruvate tautomerase MIF-related protein [Gammaproteobacteria bacterium]
MPLLRIQTNRPIAAEQRPALAARASALVSELLGKPERYVMVALEPARDMLFGGSDAPLAYMELKSIGLPDSETAGFSQALCQLAQQELGVAAERVYIEFVDAPRKMWGWNGGTF